VFNLRKVSLDGQEMKGKVKGTGSARDPKNQSKISWGTKPADHNKVLKRKWRFVIFTARMFLLVQTPSNSCGQRP